MPHRSPRHPLTYALLLSLSAGCGDADSLTTDPTTSEPSTGASSGASSSAGEPTTGTSDVTTSTSAGTSTSDATDPGTSDPGSTGPATTGGDDTTGGVAEELPPIDSLDALEPWLAEGSYRAWAGESKVHMSTGPHGGNVRTFVNAPLVQSLTDQSPMHPQGAATVKELYGASVDTIIGYAVMVKVAPDSQGGDGWYWYERLNGTLYADGTGVGLCSGCHVGGVDYFLTPFPLQ